MGASISVGASPAFFRLAFSSPKKILLYAQRPYPAVIMEEITANAVNHTLDISGVIAATNPVFMDPANTKISPQKPISGGTPAKLRKDMRVAVAV